MSRIIRIIQIPTSATTIFVPIFQSEAMEVAKHVTAVTFGVTNFSDENEDHAIGHNGVKTIS